jgi:hypothetical protein
MPWCADCDRFYNPNTLTAEGRCPTCGRQVGDEPEAEPEKLRRFSDEPAPWHFKVLVGIMTVYLSYRAFQGVEWVLHQL